MFQGFTARVVVYPSTHCPHGVGGQDYAAPAAGTIRRPGSARLSPGPRLQQERFDAHDLRRGSRADRRNR